MNLSPKINIIYTKIKGKIIFQHKYINSSYRIRGNIPRIKITILHKILIEKNIKINECSNKFLNIKTLIKLKKIIIPYSDKKISVKPPLKYSILNPET
jgi:hypothetical protein